MELSSAIRCFIRSRSQRTGTLGTVGIVGNAHRMHAVAPAPGHPDPSRLTHMECDAATLRARPSVEARASDAAFRGQLQMIQGQGNGDRGQTAYEGNRGHRCPLHARQPAIAVMGKRKRERERENGFGEAVFPEPALSLDFCENDDPQKGVIVRLDGQPDAIVGRRRH